MTKRLPCPPAPGPLEAYAAQFDDRSPLRLDSYRVIAGHATRPSSTTLLDDVLLRARREMRMSSGL